jgi:hypothetical protein
MPRRATEIGFEISAPPGVRGVGSTAERPEAAVGGVGVGLGRGRLFGADGVRGARWRRGLESPPAVGGGGGGEMANGKSGRGDAPLPGSRCA